MKIVLPKSSRGYVFSRLFAVELNDFDVERLLPSLFFLVVSRGRGRAKRTNDPANLKESLNRLAEHQRVVGFGGIRERRILEKWVRSAAIRVGRMGRSRATFREQIEYVLPLTFASYKSGFPAEIRRQRNVHLFLYGLLLQAVQSAAGGASPQRKLLELFTEAFGAGLTIGPAPTYDVCYDGTSNLDVHALLTLFFLDTLQPTPASNKERLIEVAPAIPRRADELGQSILRFLLAYKRRIPTVALVRGLQALINFGLLSYTLSLVRGTIRLVADEELDPEWSDDGQQAQAQMYVDFTQERRSPSDDLAKACVERDLEDIARFFPASLTLRTLDRFLQFQPQLVKQLEDLPTAEYVRGLIRTRREASVQARAQMEIEAIRNESRQASDGAADQDELESYFREQTGRQGFDPLEFSITLLEQPQRRKAVESYIRWYWAVGGLRKSFGILSGNLTGRRNWRYSMSDDLLAALVQLALVEDTSGRLESVTVRPHLALSDFLDFLAKRFGVLVDRPPAFLDSASAREAASENLNALKRRLRQMGFFNALSDDFTAQYIEAPNLVEVTP